MPSTTDLLTRCPQCHTAFRASAAQLAARNGRVRCGTCQHAFDAYDAKVDLPGTASTTDAPPPATAEALADITAATPASETDTEALVPSIDESPAESRIEPAIELLDPNEPHLGSEPPPPTEDAATASDAPPPDDILFQPLPATDTADEPSTPASDAPPTALSAPASHRTAWLFLGASLLLIVLLLGQVTYRFRTELATALPGVKDFFAALNIEVPLPHQSDMISIEASDLQADALRNLLILNATVKNRAPWSQSYPLLELTLTDAHDMVILRRSLKPADYLPADSPPVFGPHADIPVRLWLDTHGAAAAGYRLYVYYP